MHACTVVHHFPLRYNTSRNIEGLSGMHLGVLTELVGPSKVQPFECAARSAAQTNFENRFWYRLHYRYLEASRQCATAVQAPACTAFRPLRIFSSWRLDQGAGFLEFHRRVENSEQAEGSADGPHGLSPPTSADRMRRWGTAWRSGSKTSAGIFRRGSEKTHL